MRSHSQERSAGSRGVRGRRLLFAKPKDIRSLSKKLPTTSTGDMPYREINESFRKSAYPNAAEIFKLTQLTNLTTSQVKAEFAKRRYLYRQRHLLPADALVKFNPLLQSLSGFLNTQQVLIRSLLCLSVATLWCTYVIQVAGHSLAGQWSIPL
ncbi:hypothetical protein CDAR_556381 [Caerostris darwini]|uniref:Homeobox domain-containing protein n=1 Tax=Caerostris darwini TaxID=1538125 RepID=A0AAV4SIB3_9ARAC|nr:hypothetical protein CDAR_556381 [Caerostris darwini]